MVERVVYDSWSYKVLEFLSDMKPHQVHSILIFTGMNKMPHNGYSDRPSFYFANVVALRLREGKLIKKVKHGTYQITKKGLNAFKSPLR